VVTSPLGFPKVGIANTDMPVVSGSPRLSEGEQLLRLALKQLLPHYVPLFNCKQPELVRTSSGRAMELDIFYPELNLAFEYQGAQHYGSTFFDSGLTLAQPRRDLEKRQACQHNGITLIAVPYWWTGDLGSLAATISQVRSDVMPADFVPNGAAIIPLTLEEAAKAMKTKQRHNISSLRFVEARKFQEWMNPET
jgi:hypothetical protein